MPLVCGLVAQAKRKISNVFEAKMSRTDALAYSRWPDYRSCDHSPFLRSAMLALSPRC
jgi:hypothetical protein